MSVVEVIKTAAIGVGIADKPEDLCVIHKPGCAGAIWRRHPPLGFQSWIDALDPAKLPSTRTVLRPADVLDATHHLCDMVGLEQSPERNWLQKDISDLALLFSDLTQAQHLRLRLATVTSNACRMFHIDALTCRLICTYRGTGTQYGISRDGSDPKKVFTVATGAPMILRGTRWPETPSSGLLHRSPPIEGTGETRLVLVLDPIFNMEDGSA